MPNNRPTGAPLISGVAKVGVVLSAATGDLADADGLGAITWTWQSSRGGRVWDDIPGAVGTTYTPSRSDFRNLLRVRASFIDAIGNSETAFSAATSTVLMDNTLGSGAPTISGSVQVGGALIAATDAISDVDGLPGRFALQWEKAAAGSDIFAPIPDATGIKYLIRSEDQGSRIRVTANYTDGAGFSESLSSVPLSPVPFLNIPGSGAPEITGTAKVGQTLNASQGSLSDQDGLGSVQYQWQAAPYRRTINGPGEFIDIPGATGPSFALNSDVRDLFVRVVATYTDQAGFTEGPFPSQSTTLVSQDNNQATGTPAILGEVMVGNTVTASIGSIRDSDGIGTVLYRWQIENPQTREFKAVPGGESLQLPERYFGKPLRLEASFTDGAGFKEILYSIPTAPIGKINQLPTGSPLISGIPQVGRLLRVDRGSLSDGDGISARSLFYTWEAFDPATSSFSVIDASGQSSYRVKATDQGKQIRVVATYKDNSGFSESSSSGNTSIVEPPTVVLKPRIIRATVNNDLVSLFFNSELGQTKPSNAAFRVTASKAAIPVVKVSIDGLTGLVELKLNQAISSLDSVKVTYKDLKGDQSGTGLESRTGVDAGGFTSFAVENIGRDRIAPAVNQRSINGNQITLSLNEELAATAPNAQSFEAFVNGKIAPIAKVDVKQQIGLVFVTLAKNVMRSDTVTLSYKDLAGDQKGQVIQDAAGNDLPSFTLQPVANETEESSPLRPDFMEVIDDVITIYFNRDIDSTLPPLTAFRVEVNGSKKDIQAITVDTTARLAEITLLSPVNSGDDVKLSYTDPQNDQATGVLQDSFGNDMENFIQRPVLNSTLDRDILSLERVGIEANLINLYFNKPLQSSIPAIARFTLKAADSINLKIIRIESNPAEGQVVLTMDKPIANAKNILLSYSDLEGNQDTGIIQDVNGNDLASIANINLSNYTSRLGAQPQRPSPRPGLRPPLSRAINHDTLIHPRPAFSAAGVQNDSASRLQPQATPLHQASGPIAALAQTADNGLDWRLAAAPNPDWLAVSPFHTQSQPTPDMLL